jgi:hypothetical protein
MAGWSRHEAETFFESGGIVRPGAVAAAAAASAVPPSVVDAVAVREAAVPTPPPAPLTPAATSQPAQSAPGVFRWLVDISAWQPTDAEWRLLLTTLPEEDATKVMKFHFVDDQKRALVSRLLQRRACFEATGLKYSDALASAPFLSVPLHHHPTTSRGLRYSDALILRTKGGKPFMANKPTSGRAPRLAHDGDRDTGARSTWRVDSSGSTPQLVSTLGASMPRPTGSLAIPSPYRHPCPCRYPRPTWRYAHPGADPDGRTRIGTSTSRTRGSTSPLRASR